MARGLLAVAVVLEALDRMSVARAFVPGRHRHHRHTDPHWRASPRRSPSMTKNTRSPVENSRLLCSRQRPSWIDAAKSSARQASLARQPPRGTMARQNGTPYVRSTLGALSFEDP